VLTGFERSTTGNEAANKPITTREYTRSTVVLPGGGSNKTQLEAWLYLPKVEEATPIVLMAHGLGGQKDFGLHSTAHVFATAGLAVLVFDYATWGGSDGEPRHWVSPSRHLDDWEAAVRYIQGPALAGRVDSSKLVLWGTSYSGGHVLTLAASRLGPGEVTAIVSQVPHLSGPRASAVSVRNRGVLSSVKLLLAGVLDAAGASLSRVGLHLPPLYVRLVGLPGTATIMALNAKELTNYYAKHPKTMLGGWQNKALARLALEAPANSPLDHVHKLKGKMPVLFLAVTQDSLCPYKAVQEAVEIIGPTARLVTYDCDHFSMYLSRVWKEAIAEQLAFLCSSLQYICNMERAGDAIQEVTAKLPGVA